MKIIRGTGIILLLTSLWAAPGVQAENTAALNEVLKLKSAGMNEDTILAFVQSRNINYDLTVDTILRLREQGVSSAVLNAMLGSGRAAAPAP